MSGCDIYLQRVTAHPEFYNFVKDLRIVGVRSKQIQKIIIGMKSIEADQVTKLDRSALLIPSDGELIVRAKIENRSKSVAHFSYGQYTYLVIDEKSISFDPTTNLQAWYLSETDLDDICDEGQRNRIKKSFDTTSPKVESMRSISSKQKKKVRGSVLLTDNDVDDEDTKMEDFLIEEKEQPKIKRFKMLKQFDRMDCGAAVMATMAKYYGRKINIPTFRSLINVTREGASLLSIKRGARTVGFKTCGIYVSSMKSLRQVKRPFIALMQYHYVIVLDVTDEEITIGDPGIGSTITMDYDKFREEYSGNILCLEPTEEFDTYPESKSTYRKYWQIFSGNRHQFFLIFSLSCIGYVFGLASPIIQQFFFDNVLMGQRFDLVNGLAIGMLVMTLMGKIITWIQSYLTIHFTSAVDAKFTAMFLTHMYNMPMTYYAQRQVGDFTTRLSELGKIRDFLSNKPVGLFFQILSLFVYGTVIAFYKIEILYIIMGALPIMGGFIYYMEPKLTALRMKMYRIKAKNFSASAETFKEIETIKNLGAEIGSRWKLGALQLESFKQAREAAHQGAAFGAISSILNQALTNAISLTSIYFFTRNELTFGQVVALSALSGQVIGPAMGLLGEWNSFHQIGVSLGRVDDVLTSAPETDPDRPKTPFKNGDIEFKDVQFQYGSETSPVVLKNINLSIRKNETIALVGKSGSGKTTLAFMINRLYASSRGQILINGVNIDDIDHRDLRKNVGVIMQDNNLFSGTILENISLGDPSPSLEKAMIAAEQAQAHLFIEKMRKGYYHVLGENGTGLSGGQRQRINIARTLYHDPPILVMDEATSSLDAVTEQALSRALNGPKTVAQL